MLEMSEGSRIFLTEMRALTTDLQGNEVLVGLTVAESVEYLRGGPESPAGAHHTPEQIRRYLALHEMHEIARLQVLGAEMQLRNENPLRH